MHAVASGNLWRLGREFPFAAERQVNMVFVQCLSRCLRVSDLGPAARLSPSSPQYPDHLFVEHSRHRVRQWVCEYRRHNIATLLLAKSRNCISSTLVIQVVTYSFCDISEITSLQKGLRTFVHGFIILCVVTSYSTFSLNILKHMCVCMVFNEVPVLRSIACGNVCL